MSKLLDPREPLTKEEAERLKELDLKRFGGEAGADFTIQPPKPGPAKRFNEHGYNQWTGPGPKDDPYPSTTAGAKTARETEQKLKGLFKYATLVKLSRENLAATDRPELGLPENYVASPSLQAGLVDAATKLAERYPIAAERVSAIGLVDKSADVFAEVVPMGAYGEMNAIQISLVQATDYESIGGNLSAEAAFQDDVKSGWGAAGTGDWAGILAHEFGHVVDNAMRDDPEWGRKTIDWLDKHYSPQAAVSGYAGKNRDEFFAEYFARVERTSDWQDDPAAVDLAALLKDWSAVQ